MQKRTRNIGSVVLAAVATVALAVGVGAPARAGHEYAKTKKCKMCHNKIQYASWAKTKHAKALDNLQALSAAEITELGAKVGIQNATLDDCIRCHVTGYDAATKKYVEPGVACEACHGPGKDYAKISTMKNREAAVAAGLVLPDEKVCVGCHNDQSPKYTGFDFAAMRDKVHDFKNPPK